MSNQDRDLMKLEPSFLLKVMAFVQDQRIKDSNIFITEAWRSETRQKELVASWASKVNHSNHQDGKAFDIAFAGSELYPKDHSRWRLVWDVAKEYEIDWGYDLWAHLWFVDKPHFQDNWVPINNINMEELYPKQSLAVQNANSVLWNLTQNAEIKKALEVVNKLLREEKKA